MLSTVTHPPALGQHAPVDGPPPQGFTVHVAPAYHTPPTDGQLVCV
jgi:hypothetical protein